MDGLLEGLGNVLVAVVALLHAGFGVLESFLWERPLGQKAFGTTREYAATTRILAANQGLYNGFLAAGLVWGLALGDEGGPVKAFFLACVVVAGVVGAATANRRILWIQAAPGAVALALLLAARAASGGA